MIIFLKRIAQKLGIDKAIIFTSSSSVINGFGGLITVVLIASYYTPVEQGFYYTFGSIVAIQIFFELGLNGIITQYVAHEVAHLKWDKDYKHKLKGESKYLSRLSSLLHFTIGWYLIFALLLFIILFGIGTIFFTKYNTTNGNVYWTTPWLLLSIATGFDFILSPAIAFIQGLGKVKEMAKIRLIRVIFRFAAVWAGLILGAGLFVPGIGNLVGVFIFAILLIYGKYFIVLKNIWEINIIERVSYKKEIFPFQWKIALSWISGYFIFQLFNPVLFAFSGPVIAGQMGMTLSLLTGLQAISSSWITTKIPLFSGLIAKKNYAQLDNIFNKTLEQSALINFAILAFSFFFIFLIRYFKIEIHGSLLGTRFLDNTPFLLMMIPMFLNQVSGAWATYLRCHKKEPFLIISIVGGITCSLSTILLGKYFGVIGMTLGYSIITVLMFPWTHYIFKTKKLEWHGAFNQVTSVNN